MQIIDRCCYLVGQFLRSLLRDDEVSSLEVGKEVTTAQMLHYNIDVFVVFKNIQQSDDERMLAHLEDLNLSPLALKIFCVHVCFIQDFDGDVLLRFLVLSQLDQSKLPFPKGSFYGIVLAEGGVANHFLDDLHPLLVLSLICQVVCPLLVSWEHQGKWVDNGILIEVLLHGLLFFEEHSH